MSKPALRAKPIKLELDHPTEGKCGWVLDVVGYDSTQVRSTIKQIAAERAAKPDAGGITVESLSAEQAAEARIAASAVIGWNDAFANADEGIGPYAAETCLAIMGDDEINWVREQVAACLRMRAKFF